MQSLERKSGGEALLAAVTLKDSRAVDVGSGDGAMVRFMTRQGAHATGIECGAMQLAKACAAAPAGGEDYIEGVGQALPLPDASADLITFINSLHHVPVAEQANALKEAARVLRDGGTLYIAEPLAEGPQFELLKPIDDETDVRAAAYAEIGRARDYGFEPVSETRHVQPHKLASCEALRDIVVSIDPARASKMAAHEATFHADFARLADRQADGTFELMQPVRVNLLRRRPRSA